MTRGGISFDLFVETICPTPALAIFGSGDDAIPIAQMSQTLGWSTTVVSRAELTNTEARFPNASRIVAPYEVALGQLATHDFAVLATHDFDDDQAILARLLPNPPRYLGIIGPKRRTARLLEALLGGGLQFSTDIVSEIRTPAGLDLGGDDPRHVALSIVAEIVAVEHRRDGGSLRDRQAPIHDPHLHETL